MNTQLAWASARAKMFWQRCSVCGMQPWIRATVDGPVVECMQHPAAELVEG